MEPGSKGTEAGRKEEVQRQVQGGPEVDGSLMNQTLHECAPHDCQLPRGHPEAGFINLFTGEKLGPKQLGKQMAEQHPGGRTRCSSSMKKGQWNVPGHPELHSEPRSGSVHTPSPLTDWTSPPVVEALTPSTSECDIWK